MSTGTVRIVSTLSAALSLGGLVVFVSLHPLGTLVASLICCAMLFAMAVHRHAWLVLVPGLLPVVDLAPWTGAIYLTESDALILCAVLWLSLRRVFHFSRHRKKSNGFEMDVLAWSLVALMLASYLVSTDWSRLPDLYSDPSLLVGYATQLNGPRLAKGFIWALWLLPFLGRAFTRDPLGARFALMVGVIFSLILVALAATYERAAFLELSNFSADYRTTAFFWEANVGGAYLDGWLALTVPFALYLTLSARVPLQAAAFMALLCLAGYSVFSTFSRGLYLGIALAGGLIFYRMLLPVDGRQERRPDLSVILMLFIAAAALCFAMISVFAVGGYRGVLALIGLVFLLYLAGPVAATIQRPLWWRALGIGAVMAVVSVVMMLALPKGVYIAYVLGFAGVLALLSGRLRTGSLDPAMLVVSGLVWSAASAALVTFHWSEGNGLSAGLLVAAVVLPPLLLLRVRPTACWRPSLQMTTRVAIGLGGLFAIVLLTSTYYAVERLSVVLDDLEEREAHWSLAASLPVGQHEKWLGVGTGNYFERYYWSADKNAVPGNHLLLSEAGNRYLRLGGPTHMLGMGELYRVSQRVRSDLKAPLSVFLRSRALGGGELHIEVCRKHLLYHGGCTIDALNIPAGGRWVELSFVLGAGALGENDGLPKTTTLSLANAGANDVDVNEIRVLDADGQPLLRNGDFAAGSEFWFFSSDRHHLPWHVKNLWLHFFVEQGFFGFATFSVLFGVALYRLAFGRARQHEIALPLLGSILAFAVVGMFDSLADAPRMSTMMFLMLFLALGLRQHDVPQAQPR